MKVIIYIKLIIFSSILSLAHAQVLITSNQALGTTPHESAVLEISDNNKGLLLPRVNLTSNTDNVTVPTPVQGVLVYNTATSKFNFWAQNKWNRNFEVEDAAGMILNTTNTTTFNTANTPTSSSFSNQNFTLNSGTSGWTDLNTNLTLNPTKNTNSVLINAEGMAQMNNTNSSGDFSFAIGLFVDDKLKVIRKFSLKDGSSCSWKKFEIAGIFYNLTAGSHNVKLYARNLTDNGGGDRITYGNNANGCSNINAGMAKISLSAQLTE